MSHVTGRQVLSKTTEQATGSRGCWCGERGSPFYVRRLRSRLAAYGGDDGWV